MSEVSGNAHEWYHCVGCSYETSDRLMMKDHSAGSGHLGWLPGPRPVLRGGVPELRIPEWQFDPLGIPLPEEDEAAALFIDPEMRVLSIEEMSIADDEDDGVLTFSGWSPKPLTVEFTLGENENAEDVFDLLAGASARPSTAVNGEFSIEAHGKTPVRRRWWEWLLRRPRRYTDYHIYIPRAKMADRSTEDE